MFFFVFIYLFYFVFKSRKKNNFHTAMFIYITIITIITFLFILLNYENKIIPFADFSDATTFLVKAKELENNYLILFFEDLKYWLYIIINYIFYIISFKNDFWLIINSTFFNIMLNILVFIKLNKILEKNNIVLSIKKWLFILLNPYLLITTISTVRDNIISALSLYLILQITDMIMNKNKIKFLTFHIFKIILLIFFGMIFLRELLILNLIIPLIILFLYKFNRKIFTIKYNFNFIILCLLVLVILSFFIPKSYFYRILFLGESDQKSGNEKFGDSIITDYSDLLNMNIFQMYKVASTHIIKRIGPSFLGRSYLKGIYLAISFEEKMGYYTSNSLKIILFIICNLYQYFVFIPFLLLLFFEKRKKEKLNFINFFKDISIILYISILLIYTVKFGSVQIRTILQGFLPLSIVFVLLYDKINKIKYCKWFIFSNLLAFVYILIQP